MTVLIDEAIELPSQPLTLRVGIASGVLGRAGTVQLPVQVPNPSRDDIQLSGIAVGIAGLTAPALNADSIASLVPFQPTTVRSFGRTDTLRVFGRAFVRGRDAPVVTVGFRGVPAASVQPPLKLAPAVRDRQEGSFEATLPLAGLAAGPHVLEVTARLTSGKPVMRAVPVEVR